MLVSLEIKNFLLIKKISINFTNGFNAFTGETGAGKSIIIDHGFNLIPGFRTISIYAHLSSINENITGGTKVDQGQLIGKTGNTGTRPSTLGTKKESHLHWELILQRNNEEIYLGKGMYYEPLYKMLTEIFYD